MKKPAEFQRVFHLQGAVVKTIEPASAQILLFMILCGELLGVVFRRHVKRIVQAVAFHHGDLGALHAVELVAVGQKSVAGVGFVVAFVIGCGSGQMVFGGGLEVVGSHAVVVADGLKVFVHQIVCHGVGHGGSVLGHSGLAFL